MVTIRIAELNIGIRYKYQFTYDYVKEYITEQSPDFIVEATEKDLENELSLAEDYLPNEYLEYAAIYRKIADKITEYEGAVFHGAVLEVDGKAYLITARSGVGKTTHLHLWQKRYGDKVDIVNGDKPVLRVINGKIYACGTPWRGKEGYGKMVNRCLFGIAFLERAEKNSYSALSPSEAAVRFMGQIYMNRNDSAVILRTLRLSDKILSSVSLFEFKCNMDISAAEMAYGAFIGNN